MISFKKFITEAKFAPSRIDSIIPKLHSIFNKKLGPCFRYAGPKGYQKIGPGPNDRGYLFLQKNHSAFRLNFFNGELRSITIWNRYYYRKSKGHPKGDYTIELGTGFGIGKNIQDIIKHIKHPIVGEYPIAMNEEFVSEDANFSTFNHGELHDYFPSHHSKMKTQNDGSTKRYKIGSDTFTVTRKNKLYHITRNMKEEFEQLNEAPRGRSVSPQEFVMAAKEILGPDYDLTSVKEPDLRNISKQTGFAIPGAVWKNKSDRVGYSLDFSHSALSGKPQLYIKIGARDPITNKFINADDVEGAAELAQQIEKTVLSPNVVDEKERRDPQNLFGKMLNLVKFVARGKGKSLFIYGGPGTGKSFEVMKKLRDMGLQEKQDWFLIKGKITTSDLYQTLFIHREDNKILVFDDCDSVFGDQDAANILKGALDSYEKRVISWRTGRTMKMDLMTPEERRDYEETVMQKIMHGDRDINYPNEFEFKGKIIFISNLNRNKIDTAVLNRSVKIDMTLTPDEMFQRMHSLVDYIGDEDIPRDLKLQVLDRMQKVFKQGKFQETPSLRTFKIALDFAASGIPDWYNYLDNV